MTLIPDDNYLQSQILSCHHECLSSSLQIKPNIHLFLLVEFVSVCHHNISNLFSVRHSIHLFVPVIVPDYEYPYPLMLLPSLDQLHKYQQIHFQHDFVPSLITLTYPCP